MLKAQQKIIESQKALMGATSEMAIAVDGNLTPDEEAVLASYYVDVEGLLTKVGDFVHDILNKPG